MECPLQEQPTLPSQKIAKNKKTNPTLYSMNFALHDLLAHSAQICVEAFGFLLRKW